MVRGIILFTIFYLLFTMRLVIVESPSKAKTIEKYLGKDFIVRASMGHVRDLPKSNKKAIDVESGFIPHYEISKGKEKVLAELSALAKKATDIYLATDPDREGEAIAWHIAQVLGGLANSKGKSQKSKMDRVTFHEITESAIKEAVAHPKKIDAHLVEAQEARRVLDRLVGYDLSGLIWKKVRYGLSAGRVQSPALRILMEREREIRAFIPEAFWIITANTKTTKGAEIIFECIEQPKNQAEADRIVIVGKAGKWTVADIKEVEAKRAPKPPFITSTLQQAASSRLGLSPANTMRIAQKLYESGHITYMRTDSTNLAKEAVAGIGKIVALKFGADLFSPKVYKTKSKNAQEAHEAIRPTHFNNFAVGHSDTERKLYQLIWARAVASQMIDAKVLRTTITANTSDRAPRVHKTSRNKYGIGGMLLSTSETIPDFTVTGSVVTSPGWLLADPKARGEDVDLPVVKAGDALTLTDLSAEGKETEPPNRYTEAGLVKELEKRGIGRPSTYASIIQTLVTRDYVTKDKRTLIPTDTGDVVSSFLEENFTDVISDKFTAEMEEELDEIARGERAYIKTLKDFYTPFRKLVKTKDKEIGKITTLGDAEARWRCPACGGPMIIKLGKNGKFMSCVRFPDCSGARMIDGEEMKGPEMTGEKCPLCTDGMLVTRQGKFGPFISCNRYPKCKFIKEDEEAKKVRDTGVECTTCKGGTMGEKRGRFGIFYGCSNYPDCKGIVKSKPTGKHCSLCGSLEMAGTKTIPERCSKKTCPNHNPHRLAK